MQERLIFAVINWKTNEWINIKINLCSSFGATQCSLKNENNSIISARKRPAPQHALTQFASSQAVLYGIRSHTIDSHTLYSNTNWCPHDSLNALNLFLGSENKAGSTCVCTAISKPLKTNAKLKWTQNVGERKSVSKTITLTTVFGSRREKKRCVRMTHSGKLFLVPLSIGAFPCAITTTLFFALRRFKLVLQFVFFLFVVFLRRSKLKRSINIYSSRKNKSKR